MRRTTLTLILFSFFISGSICQEMISNIDQGLYKYSDIIKLGDEVILIDENIYAVSGDSLTVINENKLSAYPYGLKIEYRVFDNTLYFQEKIGDDIRIMSYENNGLKEVVRINERYVYDFAVSGNYVYYMDRYSNLIKINLFDNSSKKIAEKITFFLNSNYSKHLYVNKKSIYFERGYLLYRIKNNGIPKVVSRINSGGVLRINDRIFSSDDENLYEEDEINPHIVYEFPEIYTEIQNRVINDTKCENIILSPYLNKSIHYDGSKFHEIDRRVLKELKNSVFLCKNKEFYDCKSKLIGSFDGVGNQENIFDIIFAKNDTFLVTSKWDTQINKIFIYKLEDNFKKLSYYTEFESVGRTDNSKFFNAGSEGLYYCGSIILFFDKNKKFNLLENIEGTEHSNNIVQDENYQYFIGIDSIKGKQLYRFKVETSLSTLDQNINKKLEVFPNPSSQYIEVNSNQANYSIFNTQGQIIQTGVTNGNKINIANITSGKFILMIRKNKKQMSSIFIKQ